MIFVIEQKLRCFESYILILAIIAQAVDLPLKVEGG